MVKRLTKAEEEVMIGLWDIKEGTVRDILGELKQSDTPYTTVSTVIRVLEKKGFIGHRAVGTTYLYHPLISKKEYLKGFLSGVAANYFNGSVSNFATFFARETNLNMSELRQIIDDVENELNQKEDSNE